MLYLLILSMLIIENKSLGITIEESKLGFKILAVENDTIGYSTGLHVNDEIIGIISYDMLREFNITYNRVTMKLLDNVIQNKNTTIRYYLLTYRAELDATAELEIKFQNAPAKWPSGQLGFIAVEREFERIQLRSRNINETENEVVIYQVYPHTLAYKLGIEKDDIIDIITIYRENDSTRHIIHTISNLKSVLALIRKDNTIAAVKFLLLRNGTAQIFIIPADKLR